MFCSDRELPPKGAHAALRRNGEGNGRVAGATNGNGRDSDEDDITRTTDFQATARVQVR